MSHIKRAKPSPALMISLIALFVALGSGAYAAAKINTKDIKNEAVTGKKLAKNAVKSNKTKDGGLKGRDLKDETITGSKLADESVGSSKIASGAVGASKLVEIIEVEETTSVTVNTVGTESVDCPPGSQVISGGFDTDPQNGPAAQVGNGVESRRGNNGWRASVWALNTGVELTVYAYCLKDNSNGSNG